MNSDIWILIYDFRIFSMVMNYYMISLMNYMNFIWLHAHKFICYISWPRKRDMDSCIWRISWKICINLEGNKVPDFGNQWKYWMCGLTISYSGESPGPLSLMKVLQKSVEAQLYQGCPATCPGPPDFPLYWQDFFRVSTILVIKMEDFPGFFHASAF